MSADPSFAPPALRPAAGDEAGLGELAGQYELLAEAGRGGSAVVYRARDRRLLREVALKTVRLAPALDERERASEIARLAREARMTARLDHPHIVTVYAVHELRDGLAVAMQFVPGRSLKQLLAEEGALEPAHAVRLLGEVAAALAYAHAHGVVHRDVKPENIFVDAASGRALLADFGAARAGDADVRVTRTGVTVGTPAYMSPEQIDGGPVDGRADLYALGLVAWETLTGRRPWEGAGLYQTLHHQKYDVLPPIAAVRPADRPPVPPSLEYVVARLLEKRPAARWANAEVAAEQLARPALPGDYKQWERDYRRRLAEHAGGAGRSPALRASTSGPVSTADRTEQFTPDAVAFPAGAPAGSEDAAFRGAAAAATDSMPSWARPRRGRRWWVPAAGVAALLAAVPLAVRFAPARQAPAAVGRDANVADGAVPPGGAAARPGAAGGAAGGEAGGGAAGLAGAPAGLTRPSAGAVVDSAPTAGGVGDTSRLVVVASPPGAVHPGAARPGAAASAGAAGGGAARTAPAPTTPPPAVSSVPSAAASALPPIVPPVVAPPAIAAPARSAVYTERALIAAGGRHSCALDGAGYALCWGANESGQLGAGDLTARDAPAPVSGDLRFSQIATGGAHTCALTPAGEAYCWGDADRGQLGDGATSLRDAPARVAAGSRFRVVRAGLDHSCAITTAGAVACWGANGSGQLGDGTSRDRAIPAPVAGVREAAALAVGWRHACALTADGAAYCWGDNRSGQLGDGTRTDHRTAVRVNGGPFVAIAAGAAHSCAAAAGGATYCWGAGGTGAAAQPSPTRVDGQNAFVSLAAGSVHTCGRTAAGAVFCWGRNPYGQLGDGTTTDRWRPGRVAGGPYSAVSAAGAHTCALAGGAPLCWGYNVSGQLGDGTRAHHATPVRVARTEQ